MPYETYSTEELDDRFDGKASVVEVADLAAELEELREQFVGHTHETTEPEPEPDGWQTIWTTDYANGFSDYETNDIFSNSGNADVDILDAPWQSGKALRCRTNGGAIRTRHDGKTLPWDGAYNLGKVAKFGAVAYIPEYVQLGPADGGPNSDPLNIFQWKQTFPSGGGYTRRMMNSIRLRDVGGEYAFTLDARIHNDGSWGDPKDTYFADDDVTVSAGEPFTIEAEKVFDDNPSVGRVRLLINGDVAIDQYLRTENTSWGFNDWRHQWTFGIYPSTDIGQMDIYWANPYIAEPV